MAEVISLHPEKENTEIVEAVYLFLKALGCLKRDGAQTGEIAKALRLSKDEVSRALEVLGKSKRVVWVE